MRYSNGHVSLELWSEVHSEAAVGLRQLPSY